MKVLSAGAPMLSAILAAGCEDDPDGGQNQPTVTSNPKGSVYEMGVSPEEMRPPAPPEDMAPPVFDSNPKGSLYDEGFPPPVDEGIISSNPKGSLYDVGVEDLAPPSTDLAATDDGSLADTGMGARPDGSAGDGGGSE